MRITPEILRDFFAENEMEATVTGNTKRAFRDVRLAGENGPFDPDYLYFVPRGKPCPPGQGISAITLPGGSALPEDAENCQICVPAAGDERIFTLAQECFSFYNEWVRSLYECIASGGALDRIIDICNPVIKNPILIDDSSYQTLAKSEHFAASDFFDGEYAFVHKNGYHSPQYVSTMLVSPTAWKSAFISPRPMIHIFDFLAHRTVYSTIKVDDEVVGFLSVIGVKQPLTEGLIDVCECFTEVLAVAMAKRRRTSLSKQKRLNNDLFLNVFNRRITDKDLMHAIFQQAGLVEDERHFIAIFAANKDVSGDSFLMARMMELFSANMPNCYSVLDDSSIVLIVGEPPDGRGRADVLRLSREFLHRPRSAIGFSLNFDKLEQAPLYYAQAKSAVRFGTLANPGGHVFNYHEIIGYDLLYRLGGAEQRRALYHPAVASLLAHDAEKGGNLIATLRVLLECAGDTALAAEKLFLHRNSLYYRMKQISGLTGVDLQDEQVREHLMISLRAHDINTAEEAETAPADPEEAGA
ncbi:MAG: helix-turn-helix domain-containing protein [Clostridiales Family XIII bacterium]|jgi:sugar diacid utilization regulator|nr:helix-turn-helix domain-containing protein [Clostridiales Family XIII bacterium]